MPYAEMNTFFDYTETKVREDFSDLLKSTSRVFTMLKFSVREISMGWFGRWSEEVWELGRYKGDRYYLTRSGDLIRVWKGIWGGPAYIFPVSRINAKEDIPGLEKFVNRCVSSFSLAR
jgi:hypothetical protein